MTFKTRATIVGIVLAGALAGTAPGASAQPARDLYTQALGRDRAVRDARQTDLRTLEINEAGTLHPLLALIPGHQFGVYPAVDMMRLPFPDGSYDLVVHSDTLEHVKVPALGLSECRRVLAPRGALVFTVPIVVGRLSKNRAGQAPSYHGAPGTVDSHMLVHTEFGSDVWAMVLGAGFSSCELIPFCFPAGLAIIARR